jgi:hypothetical protein
MYAARDFKQFLITNQFKSYLIEMKLKSNQRGIVQISFIKRHFSTSFLQISQNQFHISKSIFISQNQFSYLKINFQFEYYLKCLVNIVNHINLLVNLANLTNLADLTSLAYRALD